MPHYKDLNNKLHFLDNESFEYVLPSGCVKISDEEAESLRQPEPETTEQTIARLESALDRYIDEQAQLYRYESIRTMVTYANDPNSTFAAEGKGALDFRSRCYTLAIMIISEVEQGRPVPTEQELIDEMPTISQFIQYPV